MFLHTNSTILNLQKIVHFKRFSNSNSQSTDINVIINYAEKESCVLSLSICIQDNFKSPKWVLMKILRRDAEWSKPPRTNYSDFGSDPVQNPDPGFRNPKMVHTYAVRMQQLYHVCCVHQMAPHFSIESFEISDRPVLVISVLFPSLITGRPTPLMMVPFMFRCYM